jgi:plasmid maintenance system antidote protein VapI
MYESERLAPITALLRETILQAVEAGQTNFKALERETGVTRASIMRFAKGTRSLRLDMADRLATYFGLELGRKRKSR